MEISARIPPHVRGVAFLSRYSSMPCDDLINACFRLDDEAAWEEFVSRFHRPISLSIVRTAYLWGEIPQQVVSDLVQETYLKLFADKCRLLRAFAIEHPEAIAGYIKTIAVNVAHDHFKSLYSQKRGAGRAQVSVEESDPSAANGTLGSPGAMERQILLTQIDQCLGGCLEGSDQERDRLVFWLYYQQGMTAKAIAALPTIELTPKGVESAILRLTRLVRQKIGDVRSESSGGQEPGEKGFRPAESY
jgi:RNA polymerase sigma-70 factor (ECF subfamily)